MASWVEALGRSGTLGKLGGMAINYAENKAKEENLYQEMVTRRAETLRKARADEMQAKMDEINIKAAQDKAAREAKELESERKFLEDYKIGAEVPGATPEAPPTHRPYTWDEASKKAITEGAYTPKVESYLKMSEPSVLRPRPNWNPELENIFKTKFRSNPSVARMESIAAADPTKAAGIKTQLNKLGSQLGLSGQSFFESYLDNITPSANEMQSQKFDRAITQSDYSMAQDYQKNFGEEQEVISSLQDVSAALEGVGLKGGIWGDPSKVNIPGYGVGAAPFRRYLQDKRSTELRQSVEGLSIAYRKKYFGASLTNNEITAYESFIGTGPIANENSLVSALQKIAQRLYRTVRPVVTPGAMQILRDQNILTYEDVPGAGTHMKDKPRRGGSSGGKKLSEMTPEEMKNLSDEEFLRLNQNQ